MHSRSQRSRLVLNVCSSRTLTLSWSPDPNDYPGMCQDENHNLIEPDVRFCASLNSPSIDEGLSCFDRLKEVKTFSGHVGFGHVVSMLNEGRVGHDFSL